MNHFPTTDVPTDIAKRITTAADQLYEENGRTSFPNVDAVRRRARVNMNDASAVMRIWRRTQTASAAPLQAVVPDAVQSASQALLTTVWAAATETANINLQAAQAGWEQERAEAEACRQQLACAFDQQTEELAAAQRQLQVAEERLVAQAAQLQSVAAETDVLKKVAAAADAKAATAEVRAREISQRADDLKAELARAHGSSDQQRHDAKHRIEAAESTINALREELSRKSAVDSELREELARLRGQVDAIASDRQTALPKPGEEVVPSTRRAAPTTKSKTPNGASAEGEAR